MNYLILKLGKSKSDGNRKMIKKYYKNDTKWKYIYKWYQLKRNMKMIPNKYVNDTNWKIYKFIKHLLKKVKTIYHERNKNMFYQHDHLNKCYVLWKEIILNIFKNSTMIIKSLVLKEAKEQELKQ